MDKIYNVLWIEDEPGKMTAFKLVAKSEGIILDQFNTSKKGIEALEKDINKYDAVILDAKGYDESEDETQEVTGLQSSITGIAGLEKQYNRKIPHFIFTGQPDLMADSTFKSHHKKTPIYSKNKDEDVENMFREIKEFADKNEITQLKHRYADVLEICKDKYIGEARAKRVFELIQFFENCNVKYPDTKGVLGESRKVVEHVFDKLNKIGVIPDEIWKSTGRLSKSSNFLRGELKKEYQYKEDILPPLIDYLLDKILDVAQDGAHAEGYLKLKADRFLATQDTGYFVKGVLAYLFEILVYMKKFIDEHPDFEENRRMVDRLISEDTISGTVIERAKNIKKGFAFLKPVEGGNNVFIPPALVDQYDLKDDMVIIKATIEKGSKGPQLQSIVEIEG